MNKRCKQSLGQFRFHNFLTRYGCTIGKGKPEATTLGFRRPSKPRIQGNQKTRNGSRGKFPIRGG